MYETNYFEAAKTGVRILEVVTFQCIRWEYNMVKMQNMTTNSVNHHLHDMT